MRWLLPAAALLLSALVVWYYVMGTPQYSLHRLAGAIDAHDAPAAESFLDVDRIAQAASETMAGDYLEREPRATQALEALGQGGARATAARALKPLVAARVRAEVRKLVQEGRSGGRGRIFTLPTGLVAAFWKLEVAREASDAWVAYREQGRGPTRFRMSQQPDRSWKIVEFDREWVRRHLAGGR